MDGDVDALPRTAGDSVDGDSDNRPRISGGVSGDGRGGVHVTQLAHSPLVDACWPDEADCEVCDRPRGGSPRSARDFPRAGLQEVSPRSVRDFPRVTSLVDDAHESER